MRPSPSFLLKLIMVGLTAALPLAALTFTISVLADPSPASVQARALSRLLALSGAKTLLLEPAPATAPMPASPAPGWLAGSIALESFKVDQRPVHVLSPRDGGPSGPLVLYLHGGAYIISFSDLHWNFIARLVRETGATVIAPDYPLAPHADQEAALIMLDKLAADLAQRYPKRPLVLMGDSAGGGLALAATMHWRDSCRPLPSRLLLLSPWLDLTMDNPAIAGVEDRDPLLDAAGLRRAASARAGNFPLTDWCLSPLYGKLQGLPPVTVWTGSADVLNPDARLWRDKALEAGLALEWHEAPDMIHVWMLFDFLPEAGPVFGRIKGLLEE